MLKVGIRKKEMEELRTLLLSDTSTEFIIIKMLEQTFSKISVLTKETYRYMR
jgi:hypothetical protein